MMSGLRPRFGLFRRGASAQQNAVSAAATGGAAAESSSDAHHLQAADADSGPPVNAAGFVVDTPHQLQPDAAAELPLVEQETVAANEELSSLPALSSLPDLHGRVSTGAEDDGRRLSAGGGVLPAGVPGLLLGVMFSLVYGLFNVAPKAMIVSLVSLFIAGFLAEVSRTAEVCGTDQQKHNLARRSLHDESHNAD